MRGGRRRREAPRAPSIARTTPYWPLGLPTWERSWVALGLSAPGTPTSSPSGARRRRATPTLPFPHLAGRATSRSIRPSSPDLPDLVDTDWDARSRNPAPYTRPTGQVAARTLRLAARPSRTDEDSPAPAPSSVQRRYDHTRRSNSMKNAFARRRRPRGRSQRSPSADAATPAAGRRDSDTAPPGPPRTPKLDGITLTIWAAQNSNKIARQRDRRIREADRRQGRGRHHPRPVRAGRADQGRDRRQAGPRLLAADRIAAHGAQRQARTCSRSTAPRGSTTTAGPAATSPASSTTPGTPH